VVIDPQVTAVVGLGASLGDRAASLHTACALLAAWPGLDMQAGSRIYASPPAGGVAGGDFLNAAVRVGWCGGLDALHAVLRDVERRLGRRHTRRWADRVLDLDLLWVEGLSSSSPTLTVPHPRLVERTFALRPLLDVFPHAIDPASGLRYDRLPAARAPLPSVGVLARPLARPPVPS
jgi:2-amino-4-hydroxy-6-hydroxymethyldihydropteridine diphosphokinase